MEDLGILLILLALAYIIYRLFIEGGNDDQDN